MKSAHSCRICGHWIEGDYNRAPSGRDGDAKRERAEREMTQGHCDLHISQTDDHAGCMPGWCVLPPSDPRYEDHPATHRGDQA
jgi:hypothetical protein